MPGHDPGEACAAPSRVRLASGGNPPILERRDDGVMHVALAANGLAYWCRVSAAAAMASRSKALRARLVSAGGTVESAFITSADAKPRCGNRLRRRSHRTTSRRNAFTSGGAHGIYGAVGSAVLEQAAPRQASRPWHVLARVRSRTSRAPPSWRPCCGNGAGLMAPSIWMFDFSKVVAPRVPRSTRIQIACWPAAVFDEIERRRLPWPSVHPDSPPAGSTDGTGDQKGGGGGGATSWRCSRACAPSGLRDLEPVGMVAIPLRVCRPHLRPPPGGVPRHPLRIVRLRRLVASRATLGGPPFRCP